MDKKNVLIVISSLTGGGAEFVAANLCKHLDREKFNVAICHLKERGERGIDLAEAGYDVVGITGGRERRARYLSFLMLKKLIQQRNIDIIHSHSIDALIDCSLCKLMLKKVKFVHTFHYGNYPHYNRKYLLLERIFQRVPDKLIAVGIEQRKVIQDTFKVDGKRITTIWNGVEPKASVNDKSFMQSFKTNGKILIGSISTFIEQKGLFELLDVMSRLKKRRNDFVCVLVGDGPLRPRLEEKRRMLNLDDVVHFTGWVENAAERVLPALDIFVQSSLWEAMSIVVLEAMNAGKAIVVTDVGDNRHVVDSGKNGIIVKKRDVAGMVSMIDKLIDDEKLRQDMGRRAREKVIQECSVRKMAQNHEMLYLNLMRK